MCVKEDIKCKWTKDDDDIEKKFRGEELSRRRVQEAGATQNQSGKNRVNANGEMK